MKFRTLIFLTCFLIPPIIGYSQKLPDQEPNRTINGKKEGKWVYWLDSNFHNTEIQDSVVYYRISDYQNDELIGITSSFYKSGKIQFKGRVISEDPIIIEGNAKWYYENGNISEDCNYENGKMEGDVISYFEDGFIESKAIYKNNKKDGPFEMYYPNHNKKCSGQFWHGRKMGEWLWYNEDGSFDEKEENEDIESLEWREIDDSIQQLLNDKQYEKAYPLILDHLEVVRKNFTNDKEKYALAIIKLAEYLYLFESDYYKAANYFKEVVDIHKVNTVLSNEEYEQILINLLKINRNIGDYESAMNYGLEAESIILNRAGDKSEDYANIMVLQGYIYLDLNQILKAKILFGGADLIAEENHFDKTITHADALLGLGRTFIKEKNYYLGVDKLRQALLIYGEEIVNNYPKVINTAIDIIAAFQKAGYFEDAEEFITIVENVYTTLNLGIDIAYSKLLYTKAVQLFAKGKFKEAIPILQDGLTIVKKYSGIYSTEYEEGLNKLLTAYGITKDWDNVILTCDDYIAYLLNKIKNTFPLMSEHDKELFINEKSNFIEIAKDFLYQASSDRPLVSEKLYDIELLTKGLILNSSIDLNHRIALSNDTIVQGDFYKLKQYRDTIAYEYRKVPLNSQRILDLELAADLIENRISKKVSSSTTSSLLGKVKWQDIKAALKENEVAIEFLPISNYNFKDSTETVNYIALLLRKSDKSPKLIPLFNQNQLDEIISQQGNIQVRIDQLYRGSSAINLKSTEESLGKLYNLIWKPLEFYIQKEQTIYFSPSGTLHQTAFAAIKSPDNLCLIDNYRLIQVNSSARILEKKKMKTIEDITLFGGVDYDAELKKKTEINLTKTEEIASNRGGSWDYLIGTKEEVEKIENIALKNKIIVNNYLGNEATEDIFKKISTYYSPSIIHIATHGFFFPDTVVVNEVATEDMPIKMKRIQENSLHRSGLLFAGANHAWRNEQIGENNDDGILTAYEASQIYLPKTQLVVLSACETGLGDIKGSEGVFGLQRAFRAAGADYLMMSLWQVPDLETAEFMEYFYKELFTSKNIETSYQKTQKYMREKYANEPYKWAAFVLVK
ncbi:MAG: CHAT domain-containing protein [Bacteroidales bacterium]